MPTKFWSENLNGRDPVGRPRRREEDNIRTEHREIEWEGVVWFHLAQNRVQRWTLSDHTEFTVVVKLLDVDFASSRFEIRSFCWLF